MKTAATLALLSSMIVLVLAAFTAGGRSAHLSTLDASYFRAELHGVIHLSPRGKARFGVIDGRNGQPEVATLSLGGDSADASVLFTGATGAGLLPGTYTIDDRDDGSVGIRALVMAGTAAHPTGVFRGHSGYLIVTAVTDSVVRGRFELDATGFLASDPTDETRTIRATGMFTATRQEAR
jgi:hypothetical protein